MGAPAIRRRYAVLATVCLAAFAINLDTTIVNVALPDLVRELRRDHPPAAVDRRRLQPRLRRAGAHRRLARRPVRPPARRCCSGSAVRRGQRDRRGCRTAAGQLIAVRFAMGIVRRPDLPDHAVDHHQHLPRARASGPRRSASGARSPASASRSGRSPAAAARPLLRGQSVFIALVPVARRRHGAASLSRARVPRPGQRPARPLGPDRCRRRDRIAGLHDHRGARSRLDVDRRRSAASPSPPRSLVAFVGSSAGSRTR